MQLSVLIKYFFSIPSHILSPVLGLVCSSNLYIIERCHPNSELQILRAYLALANTKKHWINSPLTLNMFVTVDALHFAKTLVSLSKC